MKRVFALDAVRGLAMVMVLMGHLTVRNVPFHLPEPFITLQRVGWVSMEVFFALSGFLVSSLLFNEYRQTGKIEFLRFLIRRGLKIYPTYYVVVAFSAIFYWMVGTFHAPQFLRSLFFLANYNTSFWPHFWTLSLEEHFYLSFSILLALTLNRTRPNFRLLAVFGVLLPIAACLSRNYLLWNPTPISYYKHLNPTHLRWNAVILGAWLGYFYAFHKEAVLSFYGKYAWMIRSVVVAIFATLSISPLKTMWIARFGLDMSAVAGVGVCWMALGDAGKVEASRKWLSVFGFFGKYSYGIYMFHYPFRVFQKYAEYHFLGVNLPPFLDLALYLGVSIVGGYFLTRLVELPVLAWRERKIPAHSKTPHTVNLPETPEARIAA
ncbi:MAG: acyltransferase [Bdellovibrionota bacterium]